MQFDGELVIFNGLSDAQFCALEDMAVQMSLQYDGSQEEERKGDNEKRTSAQVDSQLTIRRCEDGGVHGEDCYSVFLSGTTTCVMPHVTYAEAYYHVHGTWPDGEANLGDEGMFIYR